MNLPAAARGWVRPRVYSIALVFFSAVGLYWFLSTLFGAGWPTGSWDILKLVGRRVAPQAPGLYYFVRTDHRIAGLSLMFAAYAAAVWAARRRPPREPWPTVGAACFVSVPFLFAIGLYSRDLFEYFIRARIFAVYHENPYLALPAQFPGDLYFPKIYWKDLAWVYGPVWLYIVSAFALLPAAMPWALAAFKAFVGASHIVSALALWSLLAEEDPAERGWRTAIYLLSPLALLEGAGNGHCDSTLLLFLLAGYWLDKKGRTAAAAGAMAAAAMVKIYAGPILFFYACARLSRCPRGGRVRLAARLLAPPAILFAIFYLPFLTSVEALIAPFTGGSADRVAHSWAKAAHLIFGPDSLPALIAAGVVAGIAAVAAASVEAIATGEWKRPAARFAFVWVAVGATWFMPWYTLLPLALSLTARDRPLQAGSITMSVTAFFVHMDAIRMWPVGWREAGFVLHMTPQMFGVAAAAICFCWERRGRWPRGGRWVSFLRPRTGRALSHRRS